MRRAIHREPGGAGAAIAVLVRIDSVCEEQPAHASPCEGEATRARTPALLIELKIRQLPPCLEAPAFLRQAAAFSENPSEERVWIPIE